MHPFTILSIFTILFTSLLSALPLQPEQIYSSETRLPEALIVSEDKIYWTAFDVKGKVGLVYRSNLDGSSKEIIAAAPSIEDESKIVKHGPYLYWFGGGGTYYELPDTLVQTDTRTLESNFEYIGYEKACCGMVIHKGELYWYQYGNNPKILKRSLPDGPIQFVANVPDAMSRLVIHNGYLYGAEGFSKLSLRRVNLETGESEVVFAVDSRHRGYSEVGFATPLPSGELSFGFYDGINHSSHVMKVDKESSSVTDIFRKPAITNELMMWVQPFVHKGRLVVAETTYSAGALYFLTKEGEIEKEIRDSTLNGFGMFSQTDQYLFWARRDWISNKGGILARMEWD